MRPRRKHRAGLRDLRCRLAGLDLRVRGSADFRHLRPPRRRWCRCGHVGGLRPQGKRRTRQDRGTLAARHQEAGYQAVALRPDRSDDFQFRRILGCVDVLGIFRGGADFAGACLALPCLRDRHLDAAGARAGLAQKGGADRDPPLCGSVQGDTDAALAPLLLECAASVQPCVPGKLVHPIHRGVDCADGERGGLPGGDQPGGPQFGRQGTDICGHGLRLHALAGLPPRHPASGSARCAAAHGERVHHPAQGDVPRLRHLAPGVDDGHQPGGRVVVPVPGILRRRGALLPHHRRIAYLDPEQGRTSVRLDCRAQRRARWLGRAKEQSQ